MDHSQFQPNLTPKQIIQMGSFGGVYFHPTEQSIDIDVKEFPSDWFEGLPLEFYYSKTYNKNINYYKKKCGQSQQQWEDNGWIHPIDPRGWFQWYCRYYVGRRCIDDERQIRRWLNFTGRNGRWRNYIYSQIHSKGGDIDDETISPQTRQSLLHWGYMVNENDYNQWKQQHT